MNDLAYAALLAHAQHKAVRVWLELHSARRGGGDNPFSRALTALNYGGYHPLIAVAYRRISQ